MVAVHLRVREVLTQERHILDYGAVKKSFGLCGSQITELTGSIIKFARIMISIYGNNEDLDA